MIEPCFNFFISISLRKQLVEIVRLAVKNVLTLFKTASIDKTKNVVYFFIT